MKKGWKITLIIGLILLIGGGVSYAMGLDRDFFEYYNRKNYTEKYTSKIDGNDSYVLYKAQNEQFSIEVPKNFFILEGTHGIGSDYHEKFRVGFYNPETKDTDKGVVKTLNVVYNLLTEEDIDVAVKSALQNTIYENQYQKEETENGTIYTGESHTYVDSDKFEIRDPKKYGTNTFIGFILEKETNRSIEIEYSLTCFEDDKEKCNYDEEQERKIFKHLIESITFTRK